MRNFITFLSFMAVVGITSEAIAKPGEPNKYEITVKEFALCKNVGCSGTNKAVLGSGSQQMDIASVNPGENIGNFVEAGVSVPAGTYTYFQILIASSFEISGRIEKVGLINEPDGDVGGPTCQTNGSSQITDANELSNMNADGMQVAAGDKDPADAPSSTTFSMPDGFEDTSGTYSVTTTGGNIAIRMKFPEPAEIGQGDVLPRIRFQFSVDEGLEAFTYNDECKMALGPPSIRVLAELDGENFTEVASMVVGGREN
jgi:hypothetical protein